MKDESGVRQQPLLARRCLVRGGVVEDQVNVELRRYFALERGQKPLELNRAVAPHIDEPSIGATDWQLQATGANAPAGQTDRPERRVLPIDDRMPCRWARVDPLHSW